MTDLEPRGNYTLIWIVAAILLALYLLAFIGGYRGWGYQGYYGYHHGPSWFYWSDTKSYPKTNTRTGSLGGSTHRGGGISGGK